MQAHKRASPNGEARVYCLYIYDSDANLYKRGYCFVYGLFVVIILNYVTPGNNPHKYPSVVDYRHEVLIHYPHKKGFYRSCDGYRGIKSLAKDVLNSVFLLLFNGAVVAVKNMPQKVSFVYRADVLSVWAITGIAV